MEALTPHNGLATHPTQTDITRRPVRLGTNLRNASAIARTQQAPTLTETLGTLIPRGLAIQPINLAMIQTATLTTDKCARSAIAPTIPAPTAMATTTTKRAINTVATEARA